MLTFEQQKELKMMELEMQMKIEIKKLEMQKELKQMDFAQQKELKRMDHDFYCEKINKNSQMCSNEVDDRHDKYLDFELHESFAFNISYGIRSPANGIEYASIVKDTVKKYSEPFTIVKNNKATEEFAVHITKVSDMISEIESMFEHNDDIDVSNVKFDSMSERTKFISDIVTRSNNRFIESAYVENHTFHDKIYYVKPENNRVIHSNGVDYEISCYCCNYRGMLDSPAFECRYNINKSATGGDFSNSNVYIVCAACNSSMGNTYTIEEHKVNLSLETC